MTKEQSSAARLESTLGIFSRQQLVKTASLPLAVAAIVYLLFLGANALAQTQDRSRIAAQLSAEQARGSFPTVTKPSRGTPAATRFGIHLWMECQLFGMASQMPGDYLADVITPREFSRRRPGVARGSAGADRELPCEALAHTLRQPPDRGAGVARRHRYLHGLVPVVILGSRAVGVGHFRDWAHWLSVGVGLLAIGVAAGRLVTCVKGPASEDRTERLLWFGCLAILSSLWFVVGGIILHAPTVTHGLPNAVLCGWLIFAALVDLQRASWRLLVVVSATFGALVVHLDYMVGATPIGLAILVATLAVQPTPRSGGEGLAGRAMLAGVSYSLAAVGAVLCKQFVATIYFGPAVWRSLAGQLALRTGVAQYSLPEAAARFLDASPVLALGNQPVGRGLLLAALPISVLPFAGLLSSKRGEALRERVLVLAASSSAVFCWYLVFWNHAAQHAYFMVSLIAWTMAVGVAVAAILLFHRISDGWRRPPFDGAG